MEWVETTGKTVEEALEEALDKLGVAVDDAEYEVLEEPKTGLFGRVRSEARVRARVQPTTPRPKDERRGRGRKPAASNAPSGGDAAVEPEAKPAAPARASRAKKAAPASDAAAPAPAPAKPRRNTTKRATPAADVIPDHNGRAEKEKDMSDTEQVVPLAEQGTVAAAFVQGVVERFGATEAQVTTHELDEDTLEVRVDGGDLGLLIGPKGVALQSLQELTRTVVQRQTGARSGRILVDVSGYRAKRKEALERFAEKVADDVRSSGSAVTLEPMNPSDRKVIHDAINLIDGVSTSSSGEEPRRRVVVSPG